MDDLILGSAKIMNIINTVNVKVVEFGEWEKYAELLIFSFQIMEHQ